MIMKTLTGAVVAIALTIATTGAITASPMDVLNLASIKSSMTITEIEAHLTTWYNNELLNLDSAARAKTDHLPEYVRKQQAKEELDYEYAQLRAEFSL